MTNRPIPLLPSKSKRLIALAMLAPLCLGGCSYLPSWMGGRKEEKPKLAGERITVLPVAAAVAPDESLQQVAVQLPPVHANAEWPQHTGFLTADTGNLEAKGNFSHESSASVGEGYSFTHTLIPRPVVGGGMVFAMDSVGMLSAHDAAAVSTVRWKSKGVSEKDEPDMLGGGLAYDQGKLYVTSGRGVIAAFDAGNGALLWKKTLRTPFRSAPKVASGMVFAVTIDNECYAFNALSGDALWNHRGIGETAGLLATVSPSVAGNALIVPYSSGELYALSTQDGKEGWLTSVSTNKQTQAMSVFGGIGGDPVIDSGVAFVVSNGGLLSAVQIASGQHLWDRPITSMNTPWVAGDYLFVLTSDNTLVTFIKYDGRVRFAVKLPSYEDEEQKRRPITWKGPVLANGMLLVVGSHGKLATISAVDGTLTGMTDIPADIYNAPVLAGGTLYVVSQDATLHALQ